MTLALATVIASLATAPPNPDPVARFAAYQAAHPAFKVTFTMKLNGKAGPTGALSVKRPRDMRFHSTYLRQDFSVSETTHGYLEIDRAIKTYDEYPPAPRLVAYESDINGAMSSTIPAVLLGTDIRGLYPRNAKLTDPSDPTKIYAKWQTMGGEIEQIAKVDMQGRLTMFERHALMQGGRDLEWEFANYADLGNPPETDFVISLPLGYLPHSVPRLLAPLPIGKTVPTAGWEGPGSAERVDLAAAAGGKPFLIAYLGPYLGAVSGPSARCLPSLDRIRSHVPVFVVGPKGYRDPDGTRLDALHAPAAPMFYLVGADKKVSKLWMGFDPATSTKFERDVVDAANQPPPNPTGGPQKAGR